MVEEKKPVTPVKKLKNIAMGIGGKTKIFEIKPMSEAFPTL